MGFEAKALIAPSVLVLLWLAETLAPFVPIARGGLRDRLRHDGKNLAFGLISAALGVFVAVGLFALVESWGDRHGIGLLRWLPWPSWAEALLAFLLLDFWMYLWHRANHAAPLLWRFHRMHHSDPEMDVSTGLRFHFGEVALSTLARLVVLPVLGLSLWQVALYEAVFAPVVLLHHSNLRLPRRLDRGLMLVVVSPAMHRVHHSRWRVETDSNYGSVFPWWDRLLGTFRDRDDCRSIRLGLDEFDAPEWQSLWGMLKTPLAPTRRAPAGDRPPSRVLDRRGRAGRREPFSPMRK
jgi:sterol desaturase/sphingolipid hydroxylase (fatty acid hydroxylase superfamily)